MLVSDLWIILEFAAALEKSKALESFGTLNITVNWLVLAEQQ